MTPLKLARQYMEVFYTGTNTDDLRPLLAQDLRFEGPLFTFDSAEAYLASLRADPPEGMRFEIIQAFETTSCACLIYQFSKAEISVPMAQLFETEGDKIKKIVLIFDSATFR